MEESKIKVLIVEDDPLIAHSLVVYMKDFGFSPYPPVDSGEDALMMLSNDLPDFLLLDVTIEGDMDGIELANEVRKKHDLPIIFLTAHHDKSTMERIKATKPSAYLVKPVDENNLLASIELALYNFSNKESAEDLPSEDSDGFLSGDHFFIKVKHQLVKLMLDQILWIEAHDNYSYIQLEEKRYLVNSTLKAMESKFPTDQFMRTHRSYIVNLSKVNGVDEFLLNIGNSTIPLGKTYRDQFMKQIRLL